MTLTASLAGTTVRSSEPRPASKRITGATNSWKVKIADVGKPGSTTTARPLRRRQADRLAGLERHAVRDDPGIVELGDHAIGHVARALARSARQQHDVGELQRVLQPLAQGGDVVVRDAQPHRLAAQLPHGVGEHLRVGVVDLGGLHRLAGRDDLVAGRKDRDDRLSPDVDVRDADRGEHAGIAAGQQLAAAKHRLARGDVGSGKRYAAARRDRPGDSKLACRVSRRARP